MNNRKIIYWHDKMNARRKKIIYWHDKDERTFDWIGRQLGISRQRVQQIYKGRADKATKQTWNTNTK